MERLRKVISQKQSVRGQVQQVPTKYSYFNLKQNKKSDLVKNDFLMFVKNDSVFEIKT